jgi:hypothetical protein
MPLRHRHGYAAGIHRGLWTSDMEPVVEFPAQTLPYGYALLCGPDLPGSSRWLD